MAAEAEREAPAAAEAEGEAPAAPAASSARSPRKHRLQIAQSLPE